MRIVFISDTHNQHRHLTLPDGDVIVHAGDISGRGDIESVEEFAEWFCSLNYKHKIFIAGNHDFYFETKPQKVVQATLPPNVYYLCDSDVVIDGVKFYGSPITPYFHNWAFNRDRGADIRTYWELIPSDTDVLITHGPAYGILDKTSRGDLTGCVDLREFIEAIKPKCHLFGHIHEAYGIHKTEHTTSINGSVLNEHYRMVNLPIVLDL